MSNILRAAHFACLKHEGQTRKNEQKSPYIIHPLHVASILEQHSVSDEDILIAALLHDTIEDTATTEDEISSSFGVTVLQYVKECSDDKSKTKRERKEMQIQHASKISKQAQQIKLADKYSNLFDLDKSPPSFWSKEEIEGYWYWSYAVCRVCFDSLPALGEQLKNLFAKHFDISNLSEADLIKKLEEYYQIIHHTE